MIKHAKILRSNTISKQQANNKQTTSKQQATDKQ